MLGFIEHISANASVLLPSMVGATVVSAKKRCPPLWNDFKNTGSEAFKHVILGLPRWR